ncbi:CAP domain-containing protein [Microvirga calopogonii]|uniref:CAP domain-containing protein n=1 Tax=Microvirga calopogonii TaxID=2078013 RepID=UPI00197C3244|nr:CAP domain-containing protein [Microvirga calopogonii]
MSQATAYEQLMLELVNRERATTGAQPLAFNANLNDSADSHSSWMIATDTFSHTGSGGSTPTDRMTQAGYAFLGSWASAENIAWVSTRAPEGLQDEVELLHTNLMNSPGHKANILNGTYSEIGIGFDTGPYQSWDGAFVTENFAKSGTAVYLTGVGMADKDGDRFYDIGEGLGGLTVTAVSSTGAQYSTTTQSAGGYTLALAAGTYSVTFSGGGYAPVTKQVSIGASNVKLDLINPAQ